ncbi:MAG: hypothetical protein ABR936_06665 [Bacteroidota bacterium]
MSFANDSTGVNSMSVVRSQLQSIADEVVDSAKFDVKGRVAVLVVSEGPRVLAENAFIEALQKRNYPSVLIDTTSINQMLQVFLFNPEIKVRELDAKLSERNIRTTLEARMVTGAEREVHMLGTFSRETKDTTQVFTAGLTSVVQKNDENGILQRMLTPFIVVGGAIMIVYLFFTVRS